MPTVSARMDDTAPLQCSVVSWAGPSRDLVLSRALYATQFTRQIDRHGFVKFKHWRFYGERGVAGEDVSVWVYEGNADRSPTRPPRSPCTSFPSKKIPARSPK